MMSYFAWASTIISDTSMGPERGLDGSQDDSFGSVLMVLSVIRRTTPTHRRNVLRLPSQIFHVCPVLTADV